MGSPLTNAILLGSSASSPRTTLSGGTVNTVTILQSTAGSADPSLMPTAGLFGISTAGSYADGRTAIGPIRQINSYITNSDQRPTVAVAGWADGGGGQTLSGGFFGAVAKISSDLAWGVEINVGYSGASGSAFAGGLFVVGAYGQFGGSNTGYAIRVAAAQQYSEFAVGLGFRSDTGYQPVTSTGDLIYADGGIVADRGINMAGAKFSTAAAWLPVNGGGGLVLEASGGGSSVWPFIQLQSAGGAPPPTAKHGLLFHVASTQPVASAGTLMLADGGTYSAAIDVSKAAFTTAAIQVGGGDTNTLFAPLPGVTAQGAHFAFGTNLPMPNGVPDISTNPALKAERYLSLTQAQIAPGVGPEQNSAIYGLVVGAAGGQTQPVGVLGVSQNQSSSSLATPSGLTGMASSGGSFAGGTYYWKVTAVYTAGGTTVETTGSTEFSIFVPTGDKVGLSWTAVFGATSYNIYRSTSSGGESTSPALVASSSTNSYPDTGTATTSGAVPATSTAIGDNDALGVMGVGRQLAGGGGGAIGGYFNGRTEMGSAGRANGIQVNVENYVADDAGKTNGASKTVGVWIKPTGTHNVGTGVQFGGGGASNWNYGIEFTQENPVITATIQDDGSALTALAINGTHATAAIAVDSGAGAVLIGEKTATHTSTLLEISAPARDALPLVYIGNALNANSYALSLGNSGGEGRWGIVGSTGALLTGTAAGDLVIQSITTGGAVHLGGTTSVVKVTNFNQLGFFNVTAVGQQSTTGTTAGFTAHTGTAMNSASTSTGGTGTSAYTFGDLVRALKNYGLLAS